jgi:hypothetical protein
LAQKENAQKSDEMGISIESVDKNEALINSSDKYKKFIKPNISKIVLLLLLSPILLISFFILSCSLGFFDCNPGQSSEDLIIIPFLIVFIEIVILYLISCLIVSGWNRIFSRFHEKNKYYEKMAFLAAIIFILIILRILSKYLGFL